MSDDSRPDIWQLQAKFDIHGLVKALSSGDAATRRRAAAALRAIGAREALTALRVAYATEEDPQTRVAIAATIESLSLETKQPDPQLGSPVAAPVQDSTLIRLIEKLRTGKPDEIVEVARELGDMNQKGAVEPLVRIFADSDQSIQVRLAVAEALLKLESDRVKDTLKDNLHHTDWHIRRNGAAIMGQLQAEWAIDALANILRDPHPVVRRTARAALKHIGTPESRRALAQVSSESTRRANASPETVEGLEVKIPGHHDSEVRSGMLSKHLTQNLRRTGTKPLDLSPDNLPQERKPTMQPTVPLSASTLDQVIADLANEEAQKNPRKDDTSEIPAVDESDQNS